MGILFKSSVSLDSEEVFHPTSVIIENIVSKIKQTLNRKLEKSLIESLLLMIYDGKFPQMLIQEDRGINNRRHNPNMRYTKDSFYCKQSESLDEWCMKISDLLKFEPYCDRIIKEMYEKSKLWSNDDDFSLFQYEGKHNGRRFRVIFYNSCNRKSNNEKISYLQLLKNDNPIRILWY